MNPSQQIDKQISDLADWRGEVMAKIRKLIHEADPNMKEEWKWGTGVYVNKGMVCALSAFKDHVKLNFFKGVQLQDSKGFINAGLDSKSHRAIDFHEGDSIDEDGVKELIREAVSLNTSK